MMVFRKACTDLKMGHLAGRLAPSSDIPERSKEDRR
jgi:hypothetical protein